MMYTWRKLKYYLDTTKDLTEDLNIAPFSSYIRQRLPKLLPYLDIVVDGEYIASERLYQGNKADGLLSSIGSGNQGIWDMQYYNKTGRHRAYFMRDIEKIKINELNNGLIYYLKGECKPVWK